MAPACSTRGKRQNFATAPSVAMTDTVDTLTPSPDLANNRVLLYVSSYPSSTGPNCQSPHAKISIVAVPLDAPETASVIASGRNAGLGMIQRGQARALGRRSEKGACRKVFAFTPR